MRACGAQLSLSIAGMRRSATSAGLRLIQSSSAGCSSLQYGQPYQKKSMTSMRSPVSTGCGGDQAVLDVLARADLLRRARRPPGRESEQREPAARASESRSCAGPQPTSAGALLARHGDHLVEHLEEALVIDAASGFSVIEAPSGTCRPRHQRGVPGMS